jgi:phosphoserine phosphatase
MYEYGACEALSRSIYPILGPRMHHANLGGFLSTLICAKILDDKDIHHLIDRLYKEFPLPRASFDHLIVSKDKFFKAIKTLSQNGVSRKKKATNSASPAHNYKYKVVAFDFDGTLLQAENPGYGDVFHYSWKEVWKWLGYDEEIRRDLYNQHKDNPQSYPYQTWCDDCAEYFIKGNFKRAHVKQILQSKKLRLAEGLETTLKVLKKNGMTLAIISGGINTFYEEAVPEKIDRLFNKVFFNKFEYAQDGSLTRIKAYQNKESDFRGKIDALKEVCRMANATLEEAVFVGEGTNDIDVARSGCLSIAYPPSCTQDFKDIADVVTEDFNIATILGDVLVPKFDKPRSPNHYRKR